MNKFIKKLAYKIVFKDLKKCPMFVGTYDGRNGKHRFMYGISTVMESIAYSISEKTGDEFCDTFIENMIESENKADLGGE